MTPGINYQDSISASLSEEADNDAATQEGDDEVNLAYEDPEAWNLFCQQLIRKVLPNHAIPFIIGLQSSSFEK